MSLPLYFLGSFNRQIPICQADRSVKSRYFSLFLPAFTHLFTVLSQQKTHFCLPTKVRFLNDVCLRQMMLASPSDDGFA